MYWSGLLIVVFGDLAPVNIEISSYGEIFELFIYNIYHP